MSLKLSMLGMVTLLVFSWAGAEVAPSAKKAAPAGAGLVLEPSSMPVPGGKASLTLSVLTRQAETYIGEYQFKVSPYFFKNENGTLSIEVSDKNLKSLMAGTSVDFIGLATTSGSGKTRRVDGKATPVDSKRGMVHLRFIAESREMVFDTAYRFEADGEQKH